MSGASLQGNGSPSSSTNRIVLLWKNVMEGKTVKRISNRKNSATKRFFFRGMFVIIKFPFLMQIVKIIFEGRNGCKQKK